MACWRRQFCCAEYHSCLHPCHLPLPPPSPQPFLTTFIALMSYAYLFKYIIIGDTGKRVLPPPRRERRVGGRGSRVSCAPRGPPPPDRGARRATATRPAARRLPRVVSPRARALPLSLALSPPPGRSGEVLPPPPVHRQTLPARPRPHDRRGVRRPHGDHRRQVHQGERRGARVRPRRGAPPRKRGRRGRASRRPAVPSRSREARRGASRSFRVASSVFLVRHGMPRLRVVERCLLV